MLYKFSHIERQVRALHPELRKALADVEAQLLLWDMPGLTITQALRTPEEQEEIYWKSYVAKEGNEAAARRRAREQFSWHLVSCAADFRSSKYTGPQRKRILAFMKEHFNAALWEVLEHSVGHGDHFHLARKDSTWKHATANA